VHVVYEQHGSVGCDVSQQTNEGLRQDGGRIRHRGQHIGIGGPTWQDTSQRWPHAGEPRVIGKRCSRTGEGVHERSIRDPRFDRSCSQHDSSSTFCQCVTGSAGGQSKPKPWSVSVRAGQAVVDVDAVVTDAECVQSIALGGEILLLC